MSKFHTILLLLIAMPLLSGTTTNQPDVTIEARDSDQRQMAEWAIGRYAEASLDLPQLLITFAGPDVAECDGAPGRAYLDHEPIEIRMCWNSEFVLLHELAHVWEAHNVAVAKQGPFMALRDGVTSWAGLDLAWSEQGREHAANVIAWGLLENPYPISRTYPNDPESLMAAFQFITDSDPLHDGGTPIQPPDRSLTAGRTNPPLESGR